MARTRQIDPCYPFEKEIRDLSIPARYFYILSWCHMSDPNKEKKNTGGVMPYDLFFLKNNIFPEETIDVAPFVDELITQRRYFPFESEGKPWIWCPTMPKHQTVNHPSKGKYPDPPVALQEDYRSGKLALTQSRVERVEMSREGRVENTTKTGEKSPVSCGQIVDKTFPSADRKVYPGDNPEVKEALDKICKSGFNIYALIGKLKKQIKWAPEQQFPTEVILSVCSQYEKDKPKILEQWPWFYRVIKAKSEEYFAAKNIEEHRKVKAQLGGMSLGDILAKAMERGGAHV